MVGYVLELSHVDPLTYDLLFERFLDPNRSEAPDIDIDLCQERRYEVIEYVRRKYGEENVAQIGTFGTLEAKAAMTDVGRSLGIPLAKVEQIKKLVPGVAEHHARRGAEEGAGPARGGDRRPRHRADDRVLAAAGRDGPQRRHARGRRGDRRPPLRDLCPLQKIPNKDKIKEVVSTQWDMGDVEKAGLLKVDFLGLRNLTSLAAAVRMINERHPEAPIDLHALPLDDPETFALLQRGETKGVFQLESAGIRDLLIKMKPDRFADIIATNALYRPGPLNGGMVDSYVNRKHGREEADYPHPVMRDVLEETYGIMVYQEQVMRILNRLGGIELSKAYATIKAISKKKMDVIAAGREAFIERGGRAGAVEGEGEGDLRPDRVLRRLRLQQEPLDRLCARRLPDGLPEGPLPDRVHGGGAQLGDGRLGAGEVLRRTYRRLQADGPRASCRRTSTRGTSSSARPTTGRSTSASGRSRGSATRRSRRSSRPARTAGRSPASTTSASACPAGRSARGSTEILIKAGAFDCLGARRSQLLAVLTRAIQGGQARQEDRKRGQSSLFDAFDAAVAVAEPETIVTALPDLPELSDAERLAEEKKVLGFYMSSHPLTRHQGEIEAYRTHTVEQLADLPDKVEVDARRHPRRGEDPLHTTRDAGLGRMAKLSRRGPDRLDPGDALARGVRQAAGPRPRRPDLLRPRPAQPPARPGRADHQPDHPHRARRRRTLPGPDRPPEQGGPRPRRNSTASAGCSGQYNGNLDVYFEVFGLPGAHRAIFRAGPSWKVRHDDALIAQLESAVGPGNVRLLGHRGAAAPPPGR